MERKNNRERWLHIRLTADEYDRIAKCFKESTCRKLSDYARKMLLGKPVTINCRNASVDSYTEELAQLKTELNAVGNNFNQAVKKLNMLSSIKEFEHWLIAYELDKRQLFGQIQTVSDHIKKVSEKW